jgi:ATP-dependent Clp protease ATP-binding subunit ClpC
VGTRRVLLCLIDQTECGAATILPALGLDLTAIRVGAEESAADIYSSDTIKDCALSRAEVVLELAIGEANNLGHEFVDARHLLVALIREPDGLAGRILRDAGTSREAVRKHMGDSSTS